MNTSSLSVRIRRIKLGSYLNRLKLPLGLVVSLGFLWWAIRGADLGRLSKELQSANFDVLLLAIFVGVIANVVRAARWEVLAGLVPPRGLWPFFSSMMIGYLANNVLPARMGEIVRVYALERKIGVPKSTSAATVLLERLTDVMILVLMLVILGLFLPLPTAFRAGSLIITVLSSGSVILLFLLARWSERIAPVAVLISRHLPARIVKSAGEVLSRFVEGLATLRSCDQLLLVLGSSLLIWAIEVASVQLIISALSLQLSWLACMLIVVVGSLSFLLPAGPGGVGTYEFFVINAVILFNVDYTTGLGVTLVLHGIALAGSTGQGLICLWSEGLKLRRLNFAAHDPR